MKPTWLAGLNAAFDRLEDLEESLEVKDEWVVEQGRVVQDQFEVMERQDREIAEQRALVKKLIDPAFNYLKLQIELADALNGKRSVLVEVGDERVPPGVEEFEGQTIVWVPPGTMAHAEAVVREFEADPLMDD